MRPSRSAVAIGGPLLAGVAAVLSLGGCSDWAGDAAHTAPRAADADATAASWAPRTRPNLVLVTIDTLRADRLSSYGHPRETTPYLDALAARGARFSRAYSPAPWTAPAMASLFTSTPPLRHGVVHGTIRAGQVAQQEIIPDDLPLLTQVLQAGGYRTFGIAANGHLAADYGFGRGFDDYRCIGFESTDAIERELALTLRALPGEGPYFLWVHLFDPHQEYLPREPWISAFWPKDRRRYPRLSTMTNPKALADLDPEGSRFAYLNALYDSELRHVDEFAKELLEPLVEAGDPLVVVTSDHGEEFADHGAYGHGHTLFDELLRVPLIVRLPGRLGAGKVIAEPVSLLDVMPTLLDAAGLEPPGAPAGRSLLPLINGESSPPRAFFASNSRDVEIRALIRGKQKYVHYPLDPSRDQLFDLAADPQEAYNLLQAGADASELLAELERHAARSEAARPGPIRTAPRSAEELEELRALGYVE